MFERAQLVFFHCVSPVHMGAGQAVGAIDNPIQRERHTGFPFFPASGLKGSLRDHFLEVSAAQLAKQKKLPHGEARRKAEELTEGIFGPMPRIGREVAHAGCVAFTDAQLLLFPVRSPRHAFVWITCPSVWERFRRALLVALQAQGEGKEKALGGENATANAETGRIPPALLTSAGEGRHIELSGMNCWVACREEWPDGRVVLDTLLLQPTEDQGAVTGAVTWLQTHAFPMAPGFSAFAEKLAKHLVVVSDLVFSHFVTQATLVEPHVKIDDVTGTVEEKLLFYTENLPPESVLYALALVGRERFAEGREADAVLQDLKWLDGELVQIGGDATTGRGLVVLHFAPASRAGEGG